jgi:hypothetical protein
MGSLKIVQAIASNERGFALGKVFNPSSLSRFLAAELLRPLSKSALSDIYFL